MDSKGSLEGLKVIDLSRVLGGPYCTQILADHGADVLKIEPPQGDETRGWGPPFDAHGTASYFLGLNRNKRGMTMDLAQPAQREALLALLEDADVLVENFKTGTMEKWGLGFDTLHARFPRLVHCRVSGFGADGPKGGLPGYDAAIQAMVGLMSINGETDAHGGQPVRMGVPVVDLFTGLNAALGILLALKERERSGKGQFVEAALYDCGLSLLHPHSANHLLDPRIVPGRSGNAHPNICPYDTFATGSTPIFLAVGNDGQFGKLCELIGAPELSSDPRFVTNPQRNAHRDTLKRLLEAKLMQFDCEPLADRLVRAGVPCAPIHDVPAALADPHTKHRGMVVEIGEEYRGVASPIKLSRTPATYRVGPPISAGFSLLTNQGENMSGKEIDLNRDQVVLNALRALRQFSISAAPTFSDVQLVAASARLLLIDDELLRSANSRGVKPLFEVDDVQHQQAFAKSGKVNFYMLSARGQIAPVGATPLPAAFSGFTFYAAREREIPKDLPDKVVRLELRSLLRQNCIFYFGDFLSRWEVLKYFANKQGGTHYDRQGGGGLSEERLKTIEEVRYVTRQQMVDGGLVMQIPLHRPDAAEIAFEYNPSELDAVGVQFLGTVRAVVDSPEVHRLEALMSADLTGTVKRPSIRSLSESAKGGEA